MAIKNILLATFMPKSKIESFLQFLKNNFNVEKDKVYIYKINNNKFEYMIVYNLKKDTKINFNHYFENATPVNLKCGCIFSINALNKLIEINSGLEKGNVDYSKYKIEWRKYHNKLLMLSKDDELLIHDLEKINFCEKNDFLIGI